MSGYVYIQSRTPEHPLYTVGFYSPDGAWQPESDHHSAEQAAARAAALNGNIALIAAAPELFAALSEAEQALNGIRCTCRCTPWDQVGPAMIRARAALAAAKGEQT